MISITLDLGNVPSVLHALANRRVAQAVVNAAAESYTDDTLDYIKAGSSFTARSGQLEQSINWSPVGNGIADVYANAQYAEYVEEGTLPHVIRPKSGRKMLKIPFSGGFLFRRKVNHPGSKAYPFFFIDQSARSEHMLERSILVLNREIARANG